jgi:hypothetical protein
MGGTIRTSRPLLLLFALQAITLSWYALAEGRLQGSGDAHAELAHYFDQAWVALAIVLLVLLAGLRSDVRRLAGMLGGIALTAMGAAFVVLPDAVSSAGRLWGAAGIAAGLATIAVARRSAPDGPAAAPH